MKDAQLFSKWQESARQIVQVETELSGVYEAARSTGRRNYPILAIRGLSDIVGFARDPNWTGYASKTAAAYAVALLNSGIIDFGNNLPVRQAAAATQKGELERRSKLGERERAPLPENAISSHQQLRAEAVERIRQRHSDLVEKKFESKLNEAEQAELARINDELDDLETPVYKPIEEKLQKELDRLLAEKRKTEKGK